MKMPTLRTSVSLLSLAILPAAASAKPHLPSHPKHDSPPHGIAHPRHPNWGSMYIRVKTPNGVMYINRNRIHQFIDIDEAAKQTQVASIELPVGSIVKGLPNGFSTFLHEGKTLFYHEGVFFSQKDDEGFAVIEAPIGGIVRTLPELAEPAAIEGSTHYTFRGTSYRAINQYGKTVYEIIAAETHAEPAPSEE